MKRYYICHRYLVVFLVLCLCGGLLAGCGLGGFSKKGEEHIYYVNTEGSGLVEEEYTIEGDDTNTQIKQMLKDLKKNQDSVDYKSAYPDKVKIDDWSLEDESLTLNFNKAYNDMNVTEELLLRSATVQSLVQIPQVSTVHFTVEGEELCDQEGKEIGYMDSETFIKNVGSSLHSYQEGDLKLYFANKAGDQLVEENVSVRYNSNMSIEKLIVEQLIKGPTQDGAYPTISPQTTLLGVSVKDGICYVNFDQEFLQLTYKVSPQVVIYSLVNSITEGGEVNQVQILINGECDVSYQETIDLEEPFSRNLNLIKEDE